MSSILITLTNKLKIEIMTINDIKQSWIYQDELRLIDELHSDFIPTKQSELRKTELTDLINKLINK